MLKFFLKIFRSHLNVKYEMFASMNAVFRYARQIIAVQKTRVKLLVIETCNATVYTFLVIKSLKQKY